MPVVRGLLCLYIHIGEEGGGHTLCCALSRPSSNLSCHNTAPPLYAYAIPLNDRSNILLNLNIRYQVYEPAVFFPISPIRKLKTYFVSWGTVMAREIQLSSCLNN